MGRKRKDGNPLDLPLRVYWNHGAFRYVHRNGTWEDLGTDVQKARDRGNLYNDPTGAYGTMAYWLDMFIAACDKRVKAKSLAARTADDYRDAATPLKKFVGKMLPPQVTPKVVQEYLDVGMETGRAVRANRERAALSACMSWMLRNDHGDIRVNPCMRASGIKRNPETKRERYVEDAEFAGVFEHSTKMVRAMMTLVYRTLQRPEDILGWGDWNIKIKDGARVIRNKQGKRGTTVDIALTPEIEALIAALQDEVTSISRPWIHTQDDTPYTYDGLCAMFRRYQGKAREKIAALADMPSWGFYDLKAKGATDMWRSGERIELIQLLCGHKDESTTMIYIKARWRDTATSNTVQMTV
jgi:integrase